MNVGRFVLLLAALGGGLSTGALAQRQAQPGQVPPGQGGGRGTGAEFAGPPQGPDAIPIVEVVGCLTQGPFDDKAPGGPPDGKTPGSANSPWMVTNATEPTRAPAGWSRPEEVKAAEAKALGTLRLPLIGLVEFSPAEHKGHKVVVKGMLIKDAGVNRLNVTSLMSASSTCGK